LNVFVPDESIRRSVPQEIKMASEPVATPAATLNAFGQQFWAATNPFAAIGGNWATGFQEYLVDAFQRSVLLMELLRRRGNDEKEMTSHPMSTVLRFDHQMLLSG
jgi:hypothetical protein